MLAVLLAAAAASNFFVEPLAPGSLEHLQHAGSVQRVAGVNPAVLSPAQNFWAPTGPNPQPVLVVEPAQPTSPFDLMGWACVGAAAALLALRAKSLLAPPSQPSLPLPVAMLAVQGGTAARPASAPVPRTAPAQMLNLFGNSDESKRRRNDLSLRDAPAGSRKVTFRKPNSATTGLLLGLKFRESFGKAVFIDKVVKGTEAERLKNQGKLKEGDEVVMVSATFGDEMWSARGVGKYRLEKSIAVRQGANISLVLENPGDLKKRGNDQAAAKKQRDMMSRMQKQLQDEVEEEKKKGWFLW